VIFYSLPGSANNQMLRKFSWMPWEVFY
jgi:hypothetical protein